MPEIGEIMALTKEEKDELIRKLIAKEITRDQMMNVLLVGQMPEKSGGCLPELI
jgi:hypothetical protein